MSGWPIITSSQGSVLTQETFSHSGEERKESFLLMFSASAIIGSTQTTLNFSPPQSLITEACCKAV